jgi:hypothetical protein
MLLGQVYLLPMACSIHLIKEVRAFLFTSARPLSAQPKTIPFQLSALLLSPSALLFTPSPFLFTPSALRFSSAPCF